MSNEITIDPLAISKLPDNSITDPETIRQIALYAIKEKDNSLNHKIKKGFEVAGLYPHIMKPLVDINITPSGNGMSLYLQFLESERLKKSFENYNEVYGCLPDLVFGQVVSFDFDKTLDKPHMMRMAKLHQKFGDIVHIVTSRRDKIFDNEMNFIGYIENTDLHEVAEKLRIPKSNIHFTSHNLKLPTLLKIGSTIHYDDDVIEVDDINRNGDGKIVGILIDYKI